MEGINVKSEIGPLKKVLLHRPGNELLNLTPDTLGRLLFDDIPFLPVAQAEHDEFARILKENGIDVVYLEDLMAEVLNISDEILCEFIKEFIYEAGITTPKYKNLVFEYLHSFVDKKELVLKTMSGIKIEEIQSLCDVHASVFKGSIEEIYNEGNALQEIPGHPLNTMFRENRKIESVIDKINENISKIDNEENYKNLLSAIDDLKIVN